MQKVFCPQPGPQVDFLSSDADIVIYGGAAGGGKSFALLMEAARAVRNPKYAGVIFRRTSPQITAPGGLWDAASNIYPALGAKPLRSQSRLEWVFPSGARVAFRHLQHETDKFAWQGAELAFIGFDELAHFDEGQFWYLLSRSRSTIGVRPYVRATTNPAPGWVRTLLAPWVDAAFPYPAASGEIRRFVRRSGELIWLAPDEPDDPDQKTLCFVRASVFDNPALLEKNPEYVSNLRALPTVEMRRLLEGDWNVFEGAFFDEFSEVRHAIIAPYTPDTPPPPHWNYFGGLDWGFASPFAFGLLAADENGDVHVIESVQQARLTNDAQADKVLGILAKWGVKPHQCPIAYDPSMDNKHHARNAPGFVGEADIEAFHRAGLLCAPADNNRQAGWSQVRRFLHTDRLKIWKGYNTDLLRFLPMAPFSETDPEDQAAGEWEHLLDMLRYSLRNRVPPARLDVEALDPRNPPPRLLRRQKDEKRRL
jgi:hypothetical protein